MIVKAVSNNDVVCLAWSVEKKIENCLGFAIYRREANGKEEPLPAWVGFKGGSNKSWQARTTEIWPVQKLTWRDLTADRGKEYTYRVVAMVGTPNRLRPAPTISGTSNAVSVSAQLGDISVTFNRGILATQSIAHQVPSGSGGAPSSAVLKKRISQPGDPLRNKLSGQLREAMLGLFDLAEKEGGKMYGWLYELTDPELLARMLKSADLLEVILANAPTDDSENQAARNALKEAGIKVHDYLVASGHIGHNKFVVITDKNGKPTWVWTGSTNWTESGLCTQNNNGILIKSPSLAQHYFDYWRRCLEDAGQQGQDLRKSDQRQFDAQPPAGTEALGVWFSPNTIQKSKPKSPATPLDMQAVFDCMAGAKQGILFLVFQPGTPSIVTKAGELSRANPNLFIRGAATDPNVAIEFSGKALSDAQVGKVKTLLFHRSGIAGDADVVPVAAVKDQFGYWEKELLKTQGAHAIIHDKIVVIDPFSPGCIVITGSHNQGYRASYNNNENFLIIRGNQAVAAAYATHVLDVYDHYRWRYTLQQAGAKAWSGLATDDSWQDKYFRKNSLALAEARFWLGQDAPAP